jgi:hypothetical protein
MYYLHAGTYCYVLFTSPEHRAWGISYSIARGI